VAVANVVAKFEADISDVQAKMAMLKGAFAGAGASANSMADRMTAIGSGMATVGRKMTLGVTLPLAAIGAASVKAAMDFETSMAKIEGLVGIAKDEVKAMGDAALEMSAAFGKSGNEAAEALFFITSAGLRGADAMDVLEASMKASAIGLGDTATIADLATSAVNAYGSEVLSASNATDVMVAAVREGKLEAGELAGSMGQVLPIASAMGVSFDQVGATFAALSRTGTGASQAATQLRGILSSLLKPTKQAEQALSAMGLSSEGLRQQLREQGLLATLQTLSEAFGDNEAAAAQVFGNIRALSGVMDLMGANVATTEAIFERMNDTAGMTDEAFAVVADTAQFKLNQAMASIKNTLIEVGGTLAPIAAKFAGFIQAIMSGFQALPGPIKSLITGFGGIVAVIGPLLWISGKLITAMVSLGGAFLAMQARAIGAMRSTALSVRGSVDTMRLHFMYARQSMGMFAATAKTTQVAVQMSFRAMATAARTFMAALGPIGVALIAAGAAFEIFSGKSAGTQNAIENLRDEIDATTGALSRLGREFIATELTHNISADDLRMLSEYGITIDGFLDALERGGPTLDAYMGRVDDMVRGQMGLVQSFNGTEASARTIARTLQGMAGDYQAGAEASEAQKRGLDAAAGGMRTFTSATVASAIAAGNAAGPTKGLSQAIDDLGMSAEDAAAEFEFMRAEMAMWTATASAIGAVDRAAESIDKIGEAAVNAGTDLMGQTPKAREFRGAVLQAFNDSARAAESMSDNVAEQRGAFTAELIKIVAALRTSGVKESDIREFLGAMEELPASVADIMRSASKAIGDTDFKDPIEKAFKKSVDAGAPMTADAMARMAEGASDAAKEKLGLTLEPQLASVIKSGTTALRPTAFNNGQLTGRSIGSGMANGISASSPMVQAAIRRVVEQAKAAADAAAKSQSPSRLFAKTGDDISAGLALGIKRSANRVAAAGKMLVALLQKSMRDALAPSMGPMQAAFADVFRDVLSVKAAERELQDASWALADARDAVADAEKALAEARKKGNTRDVKAAERDLARARRDVADATKELSAAQKALDLAKYVQQNRQAVKALGELGKAFDYIVDKIQSVQGALIELQDLTAKPFGQASQVARMFGSDSNIDSVISGYMRLRDVVTESFSVLTDPKIVGKKAARRNRNEMNATLQQLEDLTREAVQLRERYQANLEKIAKLEKDYQDEVTSINARYDKLEQEGRDNLAGLESRLRDVTAQYGRENSVLLNLVSARDGFLSRMGDSTRQFVNNLSFPPPTTRIVREARRLANGIMVTVDREISEGGNAAGIRGALEQRLDQVRAFSANIRSLVARGLDPTLVQDFVAAGVSGAGDAVAELAKASDEELRAINNVQSALGREIADFGSYAEAQWYAAGIAQQEAVVGPLEAQKAALETAVADARAALDQLAKDRQAALDAARATFETEKKRIEDENTQLLARMDEIAAEIEGIVANLAATLPPRTLQAGQDAMQKLLDGFRKKYPDVARDLGKLMDALARSLNRTITMTVRTVYEAAGNIPKRAMGGPVQARTAYLVGERGPEVFVPYGAGNIIANHSLGSVPSMGPRSATASGGNTYQITVQAGVGDPREIGRATVEAITAYERSSGKVYARV
jgi:TP901 family phage tail tape measure protein